MSKSTLLFQGSGMCLTVPVLIAIVMSVCMTECAVDAAAPPRVGNVTAAAFDERPGADAPSNATCYVGGPGVVLPVVGNGFHPVWDEVFYRSTDDNFGEFMELDDGLLVVTRCRHLAVFERQVEEGSKNNLRGAFVFRQELQIREYVFDELSWEHYASAVAVSNRTIFVGSANSFAGGAPGSGRVYVFEEAEYGSGQWETVQELVTPLELFQAIKPHYLPRMQGFGSRLSVSGDVLVVGAPSSRAQYFAVGSFPEDNFGVIFRRNATSGQWEADADPTGPTVDPYFADYPLADYGRGAWTNGVDLAVFGAPWSRPPGSPVPGVFEVLKYDGSSWSMTQSYRGGGSDHRGGAIFGVPGDGSTLYMTRTDVTEPDFVAPGKVSGPGGTRAHLEQWEDLSGTGVYTRTNDSVTRMMIAREQELIHSPDLWALSNTTMVVRTELTETQVLSRDAAGTWQVMYSMTDSPGVRSYALDGPLLLVGDPNLQVVEVFDIACGNGVVEAQFGETCDDGNNVPGDGCDEECVLEECGNGKVQVGESCDDGGLVSGDLCSSACVTEVCGDGIVTPALGEECDDGNTESGDGCDAVCVEEFCGDGIVNGGWETCDDGANGLESDGCTSNCSAVELCVAAECPYPARQVCSATEGGSCECAPGFTGEACDGHTAQAAVGGVVAATGAGSLAMFCLPLLTVRAPRSDSTAAGLKKQSSPTSESSKAESPQASPETEGQVKESQGQRLVRSASRGRGMRRPSAAALASAQELGKQLDRAGGAVEAKPTAPPAPLGAKPRVGAFTVAPKATFETSLVNRVARWVVFAEAVELVALAWVPELYALPPGSAVYAIGAAAAVAAGAVRLVGGALGVLIVSAGVMPIAAILGQALVCDPPVGATALPTMRLDSSVVCWQGPHVGMAAMALVGLVAFIPTATWWEMQAKEAAKGLEIHWSRGHRSRYLTVRLAAVMAVVLAGVVGPVVQNAVVLAGASVLALSLARPIGGTQCSSRSVQYWLCIGATGAAVAAGMGLTVALLTGAGQTGSATILGSLLYFAFGIGGVFAVLHFTSKVAPTVAAPSEKVLAAHPSAWRAQVAADLSKANDDMFEARSKLEWAAAQAAKGRRDELQGKLDDIVALEKDKMQTQQQLEVALRDLQGEAVIAELVAELLAFDERMDLVLEGTVA